MKNGVRRPNGMYDHTLYLLLVGAWDRMAVRSCEPVGPISQRYDFQKAARATFTVENIGLPKISRRQRGHISRRGEGDGDHSEKNRKENGSASARS